MGNYYYKDDIYTANSIEPKTADLQQFVTAPAKVISVRGASSKDYNRVTLLIYDDANNITHSITASIDPSSCDFSGYGKIEHISLEWIKYATPGYFWGSWGVRDHVLSIKFVSGCEKIIGSRSGFRMFTEYPQGIICDDFDTDY